MTQILLNTLNNSMQEMMNKTSLVDINKQLKNLDQTSLKKELKGIDNSFEKTTTDFDKVFKKQLAKEPNKTETETNEIQNNTQLNSVEKNNEVTNNETTENLDNIKTLGEIKNLKKSDLKETLNTIIEKIDDVIDCNNSAKTLATLKNLLSEVASETTAESSLDLTLARDINELINQLQKVTEQIADKIETSTDDSCTAVVEDLISNVENIDSEISLEETSNIIINDVEKKEEETIDNLDTLKEQLLAYVNKVESHQTQEESLNLSQEKLEETDDINIEFNNDVIEFSTNIIEKPNIKSNNTTQTSEIEIPLDEENLKELNIESIKAESNNSDNNSSLMEHQTPEEYSIRASLNQDFESFEVSLDKTFETQNVQQAQIKPTEITPSKIIEQITKQMENLQNNSKVSIVLNPESLGKVTIQLLKTGEGLSAQFTVASQEVKDMLTKGLEGLKETLTTQGVTVDNVSIKLNDTQKSSYNPDWTEQEGSRGGNKEQGRSNKDEKHKELFEQMIAQTDEENGNV